MPGPDELERALRAGLPVLDAAATLDGLDQPVEVLRDPYGIPHLRARTTHDAFFAQGFVHAQDRLWQMQYDRMRGAGRLAEYLGPAALTDSVFMRRMGLQDAARADLDVLDPEARGVLAAYAAGVNAFIATGPLPAELALLGVTPEPWEGWHCALVLKVRHVLMGSYRTKLWRARLLRALGPEAMTRFGWTGGREDTLIVPVGAREVFHADVPDALVDGSNNWAVHGSRTASGKPLLAGDPHRTLEVPNVYYQNRLGCPEFDAIGLSMPGVPGLFHFGHTASVAWCITHAMADNQDLYLIRPGDEVSRRTERIDVRGADPVEVEVSLTEHGPVVFEDPPTALRWTGTDTPNTSLGCLLPILRARTVDELDEAMRGWVDPCNGLVMADVHGSIAYLHRGRVPIRHRANAWGPVPGWTDEHGWNGDVPFDALPRLRDPEPGYIVTANNRAVGSAYPHYLGMDYSAPSRARRILERLASLDRATVADMAAIHADRLSLSGRAIVKALGGVAAPPGAAGEVLAAVLAWDGVMDPDSAGAAASAAFRDSLGAILLEREPFSALAGDPYPEEPDPTPAHTRIRTLVPVLLADLDEATVHEALARAAGRLGDPPWRWDRVHTTGIGHPLSQVFPGAAVVLDPEPVGVGGDYDCVQAGSAEVGLGVEHASVARYVFDLGDWDNSAWVVPLGSSGHAASPHYADQAEAWRDVRLVPMTYSWEAVEARAESRQTLEPT